jgi:hypothetical protein
MLEPHLTNIECPPTILVPLPCDTKGMPVIDRRMATHHHSGVAGERSYSVPDGQPDRDGRFC